MKKMTQKKKHTNAKDGYKSNNYKNTRTASQAGRQAGSDNRALQASKWQKKKKKLNKIIRT